MKIVKSKHTIHGLTLRFECQHANKLGSVGATEIIAHFHDHDDLDQFIYRLVVQRNMRWPYPKLEVKTHE